MTRAIPLICLIGAAGLSATVPLAGAVGAAPHSGQAAVLFDPRLAPADLADAVARSGASIVRFGAAPGTMVVDMPDSGGPAALRAVGAWIIADPILLGGCSPRDRQTWGLT